MKTKQEMLDFIEEQAEHNNSVYGNGWDTMDERDDAAHDAVTDVLYDLKVFINEK